MKLLAAMNGAGSRLNLIICVVIQAAGGDGVYASSEDFTRLVPVQENQ